MKKPVRLQLKRKKGFNLQELSLMINGLPAVVVSRPSKWGNPFKVGELWDNKYPVTQEQAVGFYKRYVAPLFTETQLKEIKGKNLACWCKLSEKCHTSVLLKMANE